MSSPILQYRSMFIVMSTQNVDLSGLGKGGRWEARPVVLGECRTEATLLAQYGMRKSEIYRSADDKASDE